MSGGEYWISELAGRCFNGYERDHGRLAHAVVKGTLTALCGAKPGKRSAGWSSYSPERVTCPKCLNKIEKIKKMESK